jgi:hypothetical protein
MDNERQNALKARFDAIVPTLATKADIEVLRAEMHKVDGRQHDRLVHRLWRLGGRVGGNWSSQSARASRQRLAAAASTRCLSRRCSPSSSTGSAKK